MGRINAIQASLDKQGYNAAKADPEANVFRAPSIDSPLLLPDSKCQKHSYSDLRFSI